MIKKLFAFDSNDSYASLAYSVDKTFMHLHIDSYLKIHFEIYRSDRTG